VNDGLNITPVLINLKVRRRWRWQV